MRHAFLVAAHHQFEILAKTLEILDDDDVDFFIHVDKKSGPLPVGLLKRCCRHSEVRFIERRRVNWGGYSQIECTLSLMEEAAKNGYDYYHYISGVDLPIKPKSLILDYFQEWNGTEFIHFEDTKAKSKYIDRLKYHSLFQDTGLSELASIDRYIRGIERALRVDRTKNNDIKTFQYGCNWFSITHDLALYVLSKKRWIERTFVHTRCADELLIQTIVVNSPWRERLPEVAFDDNYIACLRYIDWKRGRPYVFRESDFDDLVSSPYLFARKFDIDVDSRIVDLVYNYCMNNTKA